MQIFAAFLRAVKGSVETRSFMDLKNWLALTFPKWEKVDAGLSTWKKYFDK